MTTIGGLSSKCEEFLAARSKFDSDHGVDLSAPTCFQSATFERPLFAFVLRFFTTKNHKKTPQMRCKRVDLRNRSIAQRERWSRRSTVD